MLPLLIELPTVIGIGWVPPASQWGRILWIQTTDEIIGGVLMNPRLCGWNPALQCERKRKRALNENVKESAYLSCLPEGDKFSFQDGHALGFQQQIAKVFVSATATE